jgi:3-methyladenine DNA glycosylase Tag
VERLLADPGIVRNRAKIKATINNARRSADLAEEFGSLAGYAFGRGWQAPNRRPSDCESVPCCLAAGEGWVGCASCAACARV